MSEQESVGDIHVELTGIRSNDRQGVPHVGARITVRLSTEAFNASPIAAPSGRPADGTSS